MPIFEYRCKKCGHVTEVLIKAGSKKNPTCDKCGSADTEKLFSTFAARVASPAATGAPTCQGCQEYSCPHSQGR